MTYNVFGGTLNLAQFSSVTNLLMAVCVCVCVCCVVNAVNAGQGDLEITVNGGSVPCTVQPRGNRLLHASFTPRTAVPHDVEVHFNGQEVTGICHSWSTSTAPPL